MVALAVLLVAVRTADLLFFVDWETGFISGFSIYPRIAIALSIVVFAFFGRIDRKRSLKDYEIDFESTNSSIERSSIPTGICFFLTGFATVAASVGTIYNFIVSGEIANLFKTNAELLNIGLNKLYYILLVASSLLGVFSAFWFMLVGAWHIRGEGHFAGGRFISVFVAIWYYARVIMDFIRHPVNPNNTTSVVLLFSVLLLALFYTKYTKVVSIDFPLIEDPPLFVFGIAAFLWMIGLGAPTGMILVERGDTYKLLQLIGDGMAALSAMAAIYARLPQKEKAQKPAK